MHSDQRQRNSSLGRDLDPSYSYHRAILLLSLAAGPLGVLLRWLTTGDLLAGLLGGVYAFAAVFAGWVIGREFDPDNEPSAFPGAVLAFGAWLWLGDPGLLALAFVGLGVRVINRSYGPPVTVPDSLVILVLALISMFWLGEWFFGPLAVLVFALDALLSEPNRRQWLFAGLALIASAIYVVVLGLPAFSPPDQGLAAVLLVTLLVLALLFELRQVSATADMGQPMDLIRVRAGIAFALAASLLAAWAGQRGLAMFGPVWAALLGVAIYRFARRVFA